MYQHRKFFKDYFNANPPFSATGNKKAEFPDAFILKGVIEYCKNNVNSTVLVISDDLDWTSTLEENEQIMKVDSFEKAMVLLWEQLNDKSDLYQMLISQTESAIYSEIADAALCEAFLYRRDRYRRRGWCWKHICHQYWWCDSTSRSNAEFCFIYKWQQLCR